MTVVEAMTQPARPPDLAGTRPQGVPAEPHLPIGKPLRSVQPLPLPLINPHEEPKPALDEQALHRQVAMTRAGITGTGVIVDTIA
jgi:hypothetical protein